MKEAQPRAVRRSDYEAFPWSVAATELTFELDDSDTRVTNRMQLEHRAGARADLRLDAVDLAIEAISVDGNPLGSNQYHQEGESLVLHELPPRCVVEIVSRTNPSANSSLEGLYRSSRMLCTQCEAEGFRKITAFPDRPDVMSVFTTHLEASAARYPVLLANGNPVAREDLGDGRVRVTWHDPHPKPSYLFALVAGDLTALSTRFTTASGRDVAINLYTEPHNADQCDYALDALKRAMRWDETEYGREYDLDVFNVVAVDDFNMGAMENKGLNIFNTVCVLAHPLTTTDAGYLRVEGVVAHEYFHNWSGNRVTCRDWFQLSLKEGFTVFRDAQFSADMNFATLKRIEDVEFLRAVQFPEDAGPMAHPVRPDSYIEISNFYTPTVYEKGSEVVRMLHGLLGPERFRRATDLYFERHDGEAVTIEAFVDAMEAASGLDLTQFRLWYAQAGTPVIAVEERYTASPKGDVYELTLRQSCPPTPDQAEKMPMHIPLRLGLLDPEGRELLGRPDVVIEASGQCDGPETDGSVVLHLREGTETLRVRGLGVAPVPSLLRGFSAPVTLEFPQPPQRLAFLARHDSDGFLRWDASQSLWRDLLLAAAADGAMDLAAAEGLLVPLVEDLLEEAVGARDDDRIALVAAILTLPSEVVLGDRMASVDVEGIHRVHDGATRWLGRVCAEPLRQLLETFTSTAPYAPEPGQMARRRLRNLAQHYLVAADAPGAFESALGRVTEADNLTDRLAGLRACVHWGVGREGEKAAALEAFAEHYADQKLVLDQWFALQASRPVPDQLRRVRALMDHPAFDPRNPNRLRALLGAFANQNPIAFHAPDGSGYGFLADEIIRLNGVNPQAAAGLAKPLTRWQRQGPERQTLMRRAIERIRDSGELSPDVYEVVLKSLAAGDAP